MTVYDKAGASIYLKAGVRTIERFMAEGEIAYTKIGAAVRFTEADLDAFLARNRIKTTAELEAELRAENALRRAPVGGRR